MSSPPTFTLVFALVTCLGSGALAQRSTEIMEARTHRSAEHGELPYRIFVPEGAADEGAQLPLVVFLHGAGERGDDNRRQLQHGVREFVAASSQAVRPCYVVAPQCPRGVWWNVESLVAFVEAMRKLPGVDRDRVYLTGLSMGGFATWHVAGSRPDLFAAAVPICGGGRTEDAAALAALPIWAFHGGSDRTVPAAQSRDMIEAIGKAGGEPSYTEYPDVGHDSWTKTYANHEMHEWLFAQRRAGAAPAASPQLANGDRIVFFGDSITFSGARGKGYIKLIEADLRARHPELAVELIGAGISGHKVPDLQERVERDVLSAKPTVVIIYIGINDVWHWNRQRGTEKSDFEAGLRDLVGKISAAGARVILCTPSVIGEKTDGSNEFDPMLEDYSAITRGVATETGTQLIDLRARFSAYLARHNVDNAAKGILTTDSVHLNEAGNRFVADCMLEGLGEESAPARGK